MSSLLPSARTPIITSRHSFSSLQADVEVDAVGPQVDVVHTGQIPVGERAGLVLPLRGQPGDRRRGQPGAGAEELLQRRHEVREDRPCRYSSGSTSVIFGDLRHHAGRIAEENRCRSPVSSSTRLSLTRGATTSTAPGRGQHLPRLVVAVAHHQPAAVLVELVGERGDVGGDLGLQRRGQHPPGTLAHDLVDQRPPTDAGPVRSSASASSD